MTQTAYEEAARSYGMAIQALDLQAEDDPGTRTDLLLALAHASERGGDADACRTASRDAAELARTMGDPFRLGRAAVEYSGSWWFEGTAAQDHHRLRLVADAERALRAADATPARDALLAAVLTRHAAALAMRDPSAYEPVAEEALEVGRRSGDPQALAWALQVWMTRNLPRDERRELLEEFARAAEQAGDFELTMSTRAALLLAACLEQRRDDADEALADYVGLATRSRVSSHLATSLQLQGSMAAIDGRYEDAERLILESARFARTLGTRDVLANVGVSLAPVYRELGKLAAFEDATRRVVAETPDVPAWSAGFAQLLCEIGHGKEAADIVTEIVDQGLDGVADTVLRRYTLAMLAEVAAATSCTDALVDLDTWMRADSFGEGRAVLLGAHAYHGALARYLGLAAGGLGRRSEAVTHHETALAEHQQMRARGWEARSRYDLAGALVARGEPGDADRATTLLSQVVERANELGMSRLLEQALAVKLELQGVPSGTPASMSIDMVSATVTVDRPDLGEHADRDGHVTICFSDIVGYTEMTDRLGDLRTHELLRSHTAMLRKELVMHRGAEVKSEGDGFMLAFRDPTDALAFAAGFQRALDAHEWPEDVGALERPYRRPPWRGDPRG